MALKMLSGDAMSDSSPNNIVIYYINIIGCGARERVARSPTIKMHKNGVGTMGIHQWRITDWCQSGVPPPGCPNIGAKKYCENVF